MLPAAHRMRDGDDFRIAIRRGAKVAQSDLVVHLSEASMPTDPTSVGFVVSKAVGNAVIRNRVKRQLRHATTASLQAIPSGHRLVIRALPTASGVGSMRLEEEISTGVARALVKIQR